MNRDAQQLIDATDWSSLSHAYGEASGVPALFARLQSPDRVVSDKAVYDLFGTVWHQGSLYSATAPAAHVLAILALDPRCPNRSGIVGLLAEIAKSAWDDQWDGRLDGIDLDIHLDLEPDSDEAERSPVQEAPDIAASRDAVRKRLPLLMPLIRDTDREVRVMMPYLAASCREDGEPSLPALLAALESESDPEVRASILLALGALGTSAISTIELISSRLHARCPENIAAAIALVWCTRSVTLESASVLKRAQRASPEQQFIWRIWGGLDSVSAWLEEEWDGEPGPNVIER